LNDRSFAFRPENGEISASCRDLEEAAVQQTEFDSFGERLPKYDLRTTSAPKDAVSRWVLRGGIGLFWSLVVAVLTARVIYFDPDLAAKFGQFAAHLSAVFGA
jgi:hypothetical protein